MKAYFLISVSNRKHLELCLQYALAGFTNSISGLWTFLDIQEGDFVSFLYGAKAYNLYKVIKKEALKNAEILPPWSPVTFKMSGRTYYFPFRLHLNPIREFTESLVRAEFAYVAENLLLRGGYRKTHFQADQTTLQAVSQMGSLYQKAVEELKYTHPMAFQPLLTTDRTKQSIPEVFFFQEIILQAVVRHYLSSLNNLKEFLTSLDISINAQDLEVLGEKALPEGHIDILIKESVPLGMARKIILEVKKGPAGMQDIYQLSNYTEELGRECIASALIAEDISKNVLMEANRRGIKTFKYSIAAFSHNSLCTWQEIMDSFKLVKVEGGQYVS